MPTPLKIAGLFAGIGGIERGFHDALGDGVETTMLCEWWDPAKAVLAARFPGVEIHPDVRELKDLPSGLDLLSAGFPCTDLSQAGRTAGIAGEQSGLVSHVFEALRLTATRGEKLPWLMIENVPNMLSLDRGQAMRYLVDELEALGYRWAYRVVDSRFTGVPQRRRRVILLASATEDPRPVLFGEDAGPRPEGSLRDDAFGFYWTEGKGGLGWARDAVPTLKGGSTIGIPSPPAVWVPDADIGRRFITPAVEDAEYLQGFPRGWTDPIDDQPRAKGTRWKLIGNGVTTRVAGWVADRLTHHDEADYEAVEWAGPGSWPTAAYGERGAVYAVAVSEFPRLDAYTNLLDVVTVDHGTPLSARAIAGFRSRLHRGNLGRHQGFRDDVEAYFEHTAPSTLETKAG